MIKRPILYCLLMTLVLASCIQDEPLNPEADILSFTIPADIALSEANLPSTDLFITVPQGIDLSKVTPEIIMTQGATISPASGVAQDFSQTVEYKVTSQDGKNTKNYRVSLDPYGFTQTHFDRWVTTSSALYKYETPVEYSDKGNLISVWSSSNKGVALYQQSLDPAFFPVHSGKWEGAKGVVMETKIGPGSILGIQNIPIVAGSLFIGTMDIKNAMAHPLSSTKFGMSFNNGIPDRFKATLSYKAGEGKYIRPVGLNGKEEVNEDDYCAAYAVLYVTDAETPTLDGTNILNHKNIVAVTKEVKYLSTNGMINIDVPFVYRKDVDYTKEKYKLAVIFASSFYGDRYEGVPGSKLIVEYAGITTK